MPAAWNLWKSHPGMGRKGLGAMTWRVWDEKHKA